MASVPAINEKYMSMVPLGDLSDADRAFGESLRSRGNEVLASGARQRLASAATRLRQRGIAGGGMMEQVASDAGAEEALGRSRLSGEVSDVLARIYQGNKEYQQGNIRTAWAADLAAKQRSDERQAAKNAGWWNRISQLAGGILPMMGGLPPASISPAAGNPAEWGELPIAGVGL